MTKCKLCLLTTCNVKFLGDFFYLLPMISLIKMFMFASAVLNLTTENNGNQLHVTEQTSNLFK